MLQVLWIEVSIDYSEKHKSSGQIYLRMGRLVQQKAYFQKMFNHLPGMHLDKGIAAIRNNMSKGIRARDGF